MDKIAGGPAFGEIPWKEVVYIEQAANVLDKDVSEVKIVALDRERLRRTFAQP